MLRRAATLLFCAAAVMAVAAASMEDDDDGEHLRTKAPMRREPGTVQCDDASDKETCEAPDGRALAPRTPEMQYRFLGRTGLQVSALSYGAWLTFGEQVDEDAALGILQHAMSLGINYFDNAEAYASGKAETIMGRALARTGWKRSDYVISTKIFWGGEGKPKGTRGPNDVGLSRKHVLEGLRDSLRRLQLDYVDVVFAHRYDPHTPMEEIVRAFDSAINNGLAFYWGTSEWSAEQIRHAQEVAARLGLIAPVVEQPQYNMLHRERMEIEYAPLFRDTGYGTTIWSPLASGVLTGKYNDGIPDDSRFDIAAFDYLTKAFLSGDRHGKWDVMIDKVRRLVRVAEDVGCSPAQLAIAWCLRNPHVSSVILGGSKKEQLTENVNALAVQLTPATLARIEEILDNEPSQPYDWRAHGK